MTDDGLTAALLKITEHAERLGRIETGVASNLDECQMATAGLAGAVTDLRAAVSEQGKLIEAVTKLVQTVVPPDGDAPKPYDIRPAVHWWSVGADDRRKAIEHLEAWVKQVYRPHYGHLAAMLGGCWPDHELCLVNLDWLSELHGLLYFSKRTPAILSAQGEYNTRILPATAELLRAETSKCTHRPERASGGTWRGAQ